MTVTRGSPSRRAAPPRACSAACWMASRSSTDSGCSSCSLRLCAAACIAARSRCRLPPPPPPPPPPRRWARTAQQPVGVRASRCACCSASVRTTRSCVSSRSAFASSVPHMQAMASASVLRRDGACARTVFRTSTGRAPAVPAWGRPGGRHAGRCALACRPLVLSHARRYGAARHGLVVTMALQLPSRPGAGDAGVAAVAGALARRSPAPWAWPRSRRRTSPALLRCTRTWRST